MSIACRATRIEHWESSSHRSSGFHAVVSLLLSFTLPAFAAELPPKGSFTTGQCIECHGEHSAEVHSYASSKHGVLARLNNGPPGRAPDCIACHTAEAHRPIATEQMRQTCSQCHSPHYIETLQANGERMVEIGNMKLREAEQLLAAARSAFPAAALTNMEAHYAAMQRDLANLRLGVAHQSPDYQWWLGHPALDGDLLRVKGAYEQLVRERSLQQQR